MTRIWLTAEAQVWMEAPSIETLIPLQRDRWKRKLLKKAANSNIAYWLENNKATRQIIQQGGVSNILMSMGQLEELKQANTSFLAKILQAKCTMFQDGRTDEGPNDLAERNEDGQIKRAGVDGIINKKLLQNISTRGGGKQLETMLAGKKYWRLSIMHTFMEWVRACWSHRNIIRLFQIEHYLRFTYKGQTVPPSKI